MFGPLKTAYQLTCTLNLTRILHMWLQAAARLGVSVFASGPLAEGALLQNQTLKVCPCAEGRPRH